MGQTTYHPVKNKDIDAGVVTATSFVGPVTGDVTGNVTGNVVGSVRHSVQTLTASGAITITSGVVNLNHISVIIAATLAAPVAGAELFIIDTSASGTAAHTVTLPAGVTFNAAGNNTATLNALDEMLHIIASSATRWHIVANVGSVALSTV
jgi:hypothetical protein